MLFDHNNVVTKLRIHNNTRESKSIYLFSSYKLIETEK